MVTLRKVSRRASCKALRWDNRIIFSFHLAKRIHDPHVVGFSKVTTKSLVSGTGSKESNELGESKLAGEL